jgi:hypothetical protein
MGRVAAAAIAVTLVLGSLGVWLGLPLLGLWAAAQITSDPQGFLFAVLLGVPVSMVGCGWLLYRLGDVYERLQRGPAAVASARPAAWLVASSDERRSLRHARGPRPLIDVAMTMSATVALLVMAIWFFFFAGNPTVPLP